MQGTKPGRTRERPAKECQDFCERTMCVSGLENWQCEIPELEMPIDCFRARQRLHIFVGIFVSWRSEAPNKKLLLVKYWLRITSDWDVPALVKVHIS